jgi:hypothetical protein
MRGLLRVFRPIVGLWALSVGRATALLPRPPGSAQVYTPGAESDRILLLGSGPAVSWGVLHHELGLAGVVANGLAQLTGRGVDLLVAADPQMTVPRAIENLADLRLERYDAVVATLGVNDAVELVELGAWRDQVSAFLLATLKALPTGSRLVMIAIPSIKSLGVFRGPLGAVVGAHANAMNSITREVCAQHPRSDFVELPLLPAEPHRHRSTRGYEVWGRGIAAAMASTMPSVRHERPVSGLDEAAAARWLAAIDSTGGEVLRRLLHAAAGIAGTRYAALSIAVDDHVWGVSMEGAPTNAPYQDSFTRATILSRDGIVVPDASADPRFVNAPLVAGEPHLRFFAAHPVRSPEGGRIGAFGVFDPEPDDGGRFETGHLRDFAQRAQLELRRIMSPTDE